MYNITILLLIETCPLNDITLDFIGDFFIPSMFYSSILNIDSYILSIIITKITSSHEAE
jgi:hypothetical protein